MAYPAPSNNGRLPIRQVCGLLEIEYGNPWHGNKCNPLDELIYIILSTRTQQSSFSSTYRRLRRRYRSWKYITLDEVDRVAEIIQPAGLGNLKASQIVLIIEKLRDCWGEVTLSPLRKMSDEDAEGFLTDLPGVSTKVAKCVLMYSLGRKVLPVDVHVHRMATRLGFETRTRPGPSHKLIENAVPQDLRYGFHVNAVAHGRTVCMANKPDCDSCCVSSCCHYFSQARKPR